MGGFEMKFFANWRYFHEENVFVMIFGVFLIMTDQLLGALRLDALVARDERGLRVFHSLERLHGTFDLPVLLLKHGLFLTFTYSLAIDYDSLWPVFAAIFMEAFKCLFEHTFKIVTDFTVLHGAF